jgi:hypothetical protein
MRLKLLTTMFAALASTFCSGQTRTEQEPVCRQQQARRVEIADADATIFGFTIGRTSLKEIQAKLGPAKLERVSREEESDVSVCYRSEDGTVVVFYSGSMGGWKDIRRFALWSQEAAYPHASRCTVSATVTKHASTQSGIRLGLTREQLSQAAGMPTKASGSSATYDYICRREMSQEEISSFKTVNNWDVRSDPYFDRMSWIDAHFSDSKLSHVEVGRTDSY